MGIMRYIELLKERISAVVYHYSPMYSALEIFKKGEFLLTSSVGTDEEKFELKNRKFFMSVARSLTGSYHQSASSGVMFNLDGNKLNQRYAGKSVDYFGDREEMEDRIFSHTNTIPIKGNVTSAHVLYSSRTTPKSTLETIHIKCSENNIPCYFYDERDYWLKQNKSKAVSFDDIELSVKSEKNADPAFQNKNAGLIEVLSEILVLPPEKWKAEHRQFLKQLTGTNKGSVWDKIEAGMIEASKPGTVGYDATVKVVRFMRTKRLPKLKDLVKYIDTL
jgi:hypothetical protein